MDICGQTSSRDYQLYAQPRRTAGTGDRLLLPPGMDAAAAGGGDTERGRSVRERLEATLAGLGELDYLRTRQELLVRGALLPGGDPGRPTGPAAGDAHLEDPYLSCEEKLLEENILLLRKQLNCLRRRDAGLISQLQELDRQISDLRLDTEISHDHMETDSRPSSGFYDLSDGVNGSLSNSSNSVFSECLSSSRSSTADELVGCADCEGLLVLGVPYEDQSCSGTVRRSLSAPYPSSTCSSSLDIPPPAPSSAPFGLLSPADPQSAQTSKYQCDLVARHGSDVYRYPSPLHAVAVQSPMFFQTLQGPPLPHAEDAPPEGSSPPRVAPPPLSAAAPHVHQSASWPTPSSSSSQCLPSSQTPSAKRLEGYIFGLLQRRSQPVRPSKPRTSINTDPGKSVHRQASLCGTRPGPGLGQGTLRGSEPRVLAAATASFEGGSVERRREEQAYHSHGRTQNGYGAGNGDLAQNGCSVNSGTQQDGHPLSSSGLNGHTTNNYDVYMNNSSSMEKKGLSSGNKATSTGTLPSHYKDLGNPTANSSPKELKHSCYPSTTEPDPPVKSPRTVKPQSAATPQKSPMKPLPPTPNGKGDGSPSELVSLGSSSQSQDEGHMVGDQHLPARGHAAAKPRKGGGNKSLKTSAKKNQPTRASRGGSDNNGPARSDRTAKHGGGSRRTAQCDETIIAPHQKVSKRGTVTGGAPPRASRLKRIPPSIPEDQVFLDRPMATSTLISNASSRCGASRPSHGQHRGHHGHHGSHHHQHHGRDPVVVVAKPKHKRNDYRHLRAMAEVPYDEAFRRALRRQRKELLLLGQNGAGAATPYLTSGAPRYPASPYAYAGGGSDSEYSAECASLFHSTIADTSEDERRSNYTTNRFGDSESSGSDDDGELEGDDSASVSDSQESGAGGAAAGPQGGGGGGAGGSWARLGGAAGPGTRGAQDVMTPAQAKAFVKIKASRNLKKRILRFKSGSLKLMTTV